MVSANLDQLCDDAFDFAPDIPPCAFQERPRQTGGIHNYLNDLNTLYYASADCGLGKTQAALRFIVENRWHANIMFIAPTKQLLQEVSVALGASGISVHKITSDEGPGTIRRIVGLLRQAPDVGCVLLITWNAYERLPFFSSEDRWLRIIDELPSVDRPHRFSVPTSGSVLQQHLQVFERIGEQIGLVKARNKSALKSIVKHPEDDAYKDFIGLFCDVLSENHEVFVDLASWGRIVEQSNICDGDHEQNRVYFMSMLNPRLFRRSILLGAHIEASMLKDWLGRRYGTTFKRADVISDRLDKPRNLSQRLEILHMGAQRLHSKYVGSLKAKEDVTNQDALEKAAIEAFEGNDFLYAVNNGRDDRGLKAAGATAMSTMSHGRNDLRHHSRLLWGAALQREPKFQKMLGALGFSKQLIDQQTLEKVYQAVMRTSLRDPNATTTVQVVVPDLATVNYLRQSFGDVRVRKIGSFAATRPKALTQSDKNRRSIAKKIWNHIFQDSVPNSFNKDIGTQNRNPPTSPTVSVTFHNEKYDKSAYRFITNQYTTIDFIKMMGQFARTKITEKEQAYLFNSATFDPSEGDEGCRRQDYFTASAFMVLDFDNGSLSPEAFTDIFWKGVGPSLRRSFIIMNSFSRTEDALNKFRVVMFYKRPVTSIAAHQTIIESIVQRLAENGYPPETTALDPQCKNGVQSFYVPCTNSAASDHAFFKKFGCKPSEIEKYAIDPDAIITKVKPRPSPTTKHTMTAAVQAIPPSVQSLIDELAGMTHDRHHKFFALGVEAAKVFRDEARVRECLMLAANGDRIYSKRKLEDVIDSLRKYRFFEPIT